MGISNIEIFSENHRKFYSIDSSDLYRLFREAAKLREAVNHVMSEKYYINKCVICEA